MSMQLAPDFTFRPLPPVADPVHFPFKLIPNPLGPLTELPGLWIGTGFNQIWRPFHSSPPAGQDHFLELNTTDENLKVEVISGQIPNRGLLQPDINMFGVHYLQQISDPEGDGSGPVPAGLHLENGMWLTIPATTDPSEPATIARLASIPHGTVMLAQGEAFEVRGPPVFQPVDITPFKIGDPGQLFPFPESNLSIPSNFRFANTNVTQAMVDNPNSVLEAAIAGQTITHTTVLTVSTLSPPIEGGGTANTVFLQGTSTSAPNASAVQVSAIFWIETVQGGPGQPDYLQLQYTQTVLLDFNGLSWPHVSVATLKLVTPEPPSISKVDPDIPAAVLKAAEQGENPAS
ncbi:MAG: heme-binding protein [Longimicrobiaceae bacterium]